MCRICTKTLGRVSYPVNTPAEKGSNTTLMEECFGGPVAHDKAINLPRFCNTCYLTMRRMHETSIEGWCGVQDFSLTLYSWTKHVEGLCNTCMMVEGRKTGGRPKSKRNIIGCPKYLTEHIRSVAGPRYRCSVPLTTDRFSFTSGCFDELVCKSCKSVFCRVAVQTPGVSPMLFNSIEV